MKTTTMLSHLSLLVVTQAGVIATSNPCETTEDLPTITVTAGSDSKYSHFYTKACDDVACGEPIVELAPPPGFTCAAVACSDYDSGGRRTATLTFPIESIKAHSASGYTVKATDAPGHGSEDTCDGDFSNPTPTTAPVATAAYTGAMKAPSEELATDTEQGVNQHAPNSGAAPESPSEINAATGASVAGAPAPSNKSCVIRLTVMH
ncbi:Fc.00g095150.m01.CDS01 [Cosmosporella sp. VM-42]